MNINVIFSNRKLKTWLLFKTLLKQKIDMWMLYLIYKTYAKKKEENAEKGVGAREEILRLKKCSKEQHGNLLLCGF